MEKNNLGAIRETQIVNPNHGIKSNQTHQRTLRQLLNHQHNLASQSTQLLLRHRRINHKHERSRPKPKPKPLTDDPIRGVLDGAVSGEKLGGEVGLGDAGVRRRERVLVEAEGTSPDSRLVIDASVRVQHRAARGADQGIVWDGGEVGEVHEWSVHDA